MTVPSTAENQARNAARRFEQHALASYLEACRKGWQHCASNIPTTPEKGIVVCQYAVRHYSTSIDDAFRNFDVRELRSRVLEKLKRETFEVKELTQSLEPKPAP